MEILVWVFFVVLGLLLQAYFLLAFPSYLAVKTVKVLFPSILEDYRLSLRQRYRGISEGMLHFSMLAVLTLVILHLGIDIFLEIPTWAPWVPEGLHHMYHRIPFTMPIAMFIAKITSVLYFGSRCQKKSRE